MTPQDFCYWLQGLLEGGDVKQLDERQTTMVREHLQLVFTKVTPDRPALGPDRDVRDPPVPAPPASTESDEMIAAIRRVAAAAGPPPRRLCSGGERFC